MIQLTIMKITGYGPWTLTLGSDREHELQILQASLYQNVQKLFSEKNGLVFQAQVAYLIPIFGVILGYLFLKELITIKVVFALIAVVIGIYLVKRSSKNNITSAS